MVIIKIISGPQAGQKNLVPLQPNDLAILSKKGWRWEVDWETVPNQEIYEWVKYDLVNKITSALIRGAAIQFLEHEWQVNSPELITIELMGEIEDTIVNSGFNIVVQSDEENTLIIGTQGTENIVQ